MKSIETVERIATKIHGLDSRKRILEKVTEEFSKVDDLSSTIFLLNPDRSGAYVETTSLRPGILRFAERVTGLTIAAVDFDLHSTPLQEVISSGKTMTTSTEAFMRALDIPGPVVRVVSRAVPSKTSILTPLKSGKETIGVLSVSSTEMADYFIPPVRNLARHISMALELAETQQRYLDLVDNLQAGVYRSTPDRNGHFTEVNSAMVDIFEADSKEDLLSVSIRDLYAEPDRRDRLREKLQNGGIARNQELRLRTLKGREFWGSVTVVRVSQEGKGYYDGVLQDITEQKKAQDRIKESERKLRTIMENSPDAIFITDKEGNYQYVNQAACDLLGYSVDELTKMNIADISVRGEIEKNVENFQALLNGEDLFTEVKLVRKDGSTVPTTLNATVLPNGLVYGSCRDISERKEMLKKVSRLAAIVESSEDAIIGKTLDGTITDWNRGAEKVFGYSQEETIGKNISIIVPKERENELQEIFGEIRSGNKVGNLETKRIRKNGEEIDINLTVSPIEQAGEIVGASAIARDITKRKEFEKHLQRAHDIINRSPAVAFIWRNQEGWPVEYVSSNVKDLLGYTAGEITSGRVPYSEVVHQDDRSLVKSEVTEHSEKGESNFVHSPYRIVTKSGQVKWVEDKTVIRRDDQGSIIRYGGIVEDITKRKRMEEKLRESEKRYRDLFENANDLIQAVNSESQFIYVNSKWERALGYSEEEAKKMNFTDILREDQIPHCMEVFARLRNGETIDNVETVFVSKSGKEIIVEGNINVQLEGREMVSTRGIFRDITQRKHAEEKLREYSERLEELVKERTRDLEEAHEELVKKERMAAIGQTAGMVAHDLRSPLQVMTNSIFLARKALKDEDSQSLGNEAMVHLEKIKEQVEHMDSLISGIREFNKDIEIEPVKTDLCKLVNEVISETEFPDNIQPEFLSQDPLSHVNLDPESMRRVLNNLITNAIQAMPQGGNLTITLSRDGDEATISVKDTGKGIPEKEMEKLFEPLFTTKKDGQGFGLAVCKQHVEAHGGSIEVTSEVGEGTTFKVRLPLQKGELAQMPGKEGLKAAE